MNYMSVCSGVEAASLAWEGLGWKPVAFSEIEPFPCAVLAERFPGVPNLGDMTRIEVTDDEIHGAGFTVCRRDVDLLVGGTPCQSFSVAGLREGLKGASGLAFHFVRLLREIQPKWFVWENVPGALSSRTDGQLDFNFLVGAFAECGYGLAWRILDAQYVRSKSFPFAIPQRRRRLFVVGCLGDGESAGKVLFDGESLSWDTPARRTTKQGASGCTERSLGMSVRTAHTKANGCGIGVGAAHTLGASDVDAVWWDGSDKADTLATTSDAQRMPDKGRLNCVVDMRRLITEWNVSPTLVATDHKGGKVVADTLDQNLIAYENHAQACRVKETGDVSPTLLCMSGVNRTLVQDVGQTVFSKTGRPTEAGGCPNFKETGVANTLNLWDLGESRANDLVVGYDNHPNDSRVTEALGAFACLPSNMGTGGNNTPLVKEVLDSANTECYPLNGMSMVAEFKAGDRRSTGIGRPGDPLPTITAHHHHAVTIPQKDVAYQKHMTVRRITPVEAERLMGFPDNWTRIPWRGKPAEQCPDGPRYKACGNSFCVNCVEWIGERIEKVERELQEG